MTTKPATEGSTVELIRHGFASLRLYRMTNRGRPLWCLAYSQGGKRVRRNFADEATARREGKAMAMRMAEGQLAALQLTNDDASAYLASLSALKASAKRLDVATGEYAEAAKILAGRTSITEAARFYVRHFADVKECQVADVVEQIIAETAQDKKSKQYVSDLRRRLRPFGASFGGYMTNVKGPMIEAWLRSLDCAPRTRNNFRSSIVTLFRFARRKGYLPRDRRTEAEDLPRAKLLHDEVEIFTPGELRSWLNLAEPALIPFLVIGAFAGLRHAEILRLEWKDVRFDRGHIFVRALHAKTRSRRHVPILPALAAWLLPLRRATGQVLPRSKVDDLIAKARRAHGLPWRMNGLRHSFGSYRLAETKNASQVSLEMGNSPAMIFAHYRETVTEDAAREWFGIMSPVEVELGKIVQMKQADPPTPAVPVKKAAGQHP